MNTSPTNKQGCCCIKGNKLTKILCPIHGDNPPTNEEKLKGWCTCASFFTVRGEHRKDCPEYPTNERDAKTPQPKGALVRETNAQSLTSMIPHEREWSTIRKNLLATVKKYPKLIADVIDAAYLAGLEATKSLILNAAPNCLR